MFSGERQLPDGRPVDAGAWFVPSVPEPAVQAHQQQLDIGQRGALVAQPHRDLAGRVVRDLLQGRDRVQHLQVTVDRAGLDEAEDERGGADLEQAGE